MTTVLFSVIILVSLFYVLIPLFKEPYWPFLKRSVLSELHSARKEGLMAISDLDTEYEMGKLSRTDYVLLRDSLKIEIAPILKKEREMAGKEHSEPAGRTDNITLKMLREVVRICGIKHSS